MTASPTPLLQVIAERIVRKYLDKLEREKSKACGVDVARAGQNGKV
jgi:hypothetical protein